MGRIDRPPSVHAWERPCGEPRRRLHSIRPGRYCGGAPLRPRVGAGRLRVCAVAHVRVAGASCCPGSIFAPYWAVPCRRRDMSEKSFEHNGHQVAISVLQTGDRWSWSYRIDDREPVSNAVRGAFRGSGSQRGKTRSHCRDQGTGGRAVVRAPPHSANRFHAVPWRYVPLPGGTAMTSSEYAAESLVRVYLNGRMMPRVLQDAVVWVVASRLTGGEKPELDATVRSDIDHQAVAPPGCIVALSERPVLCALVQRSAGAGAAGAAQSAGIEQV